MEFPLEAGLPPAFSVMDEVESSVDLDDRWSRIAEFFLSRRASGDWNAPAIIEAMQAGLSKTNLKDLYKKLSESWELVSDRTWGADEARADLADRYRRQRSAILAELDLPVGTKDGLLDHLLENHQVLFTAVGEQSDAELLLELDKHFAIAPSLSTKGSKKVWEDPKAVRDQIIDLAALRDDLGKMLFFAALDAVCERVLSEAEHRRASGRLTFQDLLVMARQLLQSKPEVLEILHQRYRWIMVDEFQDTDPIQLDLVVWIAANEAIKPANPTDPRTASRLFFVGDPKQSIYRFRRADPRMIGQVQDQFAQQEGGRVVLRTNFRSVPDIVNFTNGIFGHQFQAEMGIQFAYEPIEAIREAQPEASPAVRVIGGGLTQEHLEEGHDHLLSFLRLKEAESFRNVLHAISLGDPNFQVRDESLGVEQWRPARLGDCMILVPGRTIVPLYEEVFTEAGIPLCLESASLIFASQEVMDLLNVLRAIDDPRDEVALVGALTSPFLGSDDEVLVEHHFAKRSFDYTEQKNRKGALKDAFEFLHELHAKTLTEEPATIVAEVLASRHAALMALTGFRARETWRRYQFVADRARLYAENGRSGLHGFLRWIDTQADEKKKVREAVLPESDHDAVRVMTLHSAKGLEFPVVFVGGLSSELSKESGLRVHFADYQGGSRIEFRAASRGGVGTPGFKELADLEDQIAVAEAVRLRYVALTRAKDHLIISLLHKANPKADGTANGKRSHAREIQQSLEQAEPHFQNFVAEFIEITTSKNSDLVEEAIAEASREGLETWVTAHTAAWQAASGSSSWSATRLREVLSGDEAQQEAREEEHAGAATLPIGRSGTKVGRAVHAVLQLIDFEKPGGLNELAVQQAEIEGVGEDSALVGKLAQGALDHQVMAELRAARSLHREIYLAAPMGAVVIEGILDLLFEDAEGKLH
ncbi:MAG: UvrD-helicase domain-containing protein, partial [Actinobacteria bacterium]|nr:UvrD-helicase domain-containing protein [Actinomycetota bacterium]